MRALKLSVQGLTVSLPEIDPNLAFRNLQNQVHIWAVNLGQWSLPCHEALKILPENERRKSERFRFEILRTRYIKGHYMLRALLGMYLGVDFYDQGFHINKHGKPSIKKAEGSRPLYFNLSNSENAFVCVFTEEGDIGVDVEKIYDIPDMHGIVERFFSPLENKTFHSLPVHLRKIFFFKYWTRKEALLKAMGVGLYFPLDKVDVIDAQEESSEVFIKKTWLNTESGWTLKDINVFEGFASALALQGNDPDCSGQLKYFHLA